MESMQAWETGVMHIGNTQLWGHNTIEINRRKLIKGSQAGERKENGNGITFIIFYPFLRWLWS